MNGAHADQHEASMAQGAQARRARRADVDALWEWLEGTDVLRGGERFPAANRAQFEQWFAGSLKRRDQLVFALAAGEEPHALLVIRRGSLEASAFLLSRPGHTTAADVSALLDLASDELRVLWTVRTLEVDLLGAPHPDGKKDTSVTRELTEMTSDEVKAYKASVWQSKGAAESYQEQVYLERSGITLTKNIFEIDFVLRHARGRVLDAGAGTGRFSIPLQQAGHDVVAFDVSAQMLAVARRHATDLLPALQGDLLHLPFADDSFDSITSITVIEHLPQYKAALTELLRVLRPGGTIVFQLRSTDEAGGDDRLTGLYVVELTRPELDTLLADLGLEVVTVAPYGLWMANPAMQRRLGGAYKFLHRCMDRILRVLLFARLLARYEDARVTKRPISATKLFMVVARKPA